MKRWVIPLALLAALMLVMGAAGADRVEVTDHDDSSGADVAEVVVSHSSIGWVPKARLLRHSIRFQETVGSSQLSEYDVVMQFDLNGDGWDRRLIVRPQAQGSFSSAMSDRNGRFRGFANSYVYDGDNRFLRIEFAKALLARGVDSYRWRVVLFDRAVEQMRCDQPICDRVPDSGWKLHRL